MNYKKIISCSLIIITISGIFFGIFQRRKVQAADLCDPTTQTYVSGYGCVSNQQIKNFSVQSASADKKAGSSGIPMADCSVLDGDIVTEECLLYLGARITYWSFSGASFLMGLAGKILDYSIDFTINSDTLKTLVDDPTSAVNAGWRLGRDIVNLLLIFILLFIAISTILQVSRFGAKELLATLIIVAFLVNFSLVITKLVIDASNVFAIEFYRAFPTQNDKVSLSGAFKQGFEPSQILEMPDKGAKASATLYWRLIIALSFGTVIVLIAGFVFLVAAILLLIRMVVLMLLMVFSSLAFGAHVLPSTKKHASKWWSTLFSQAFFAPAMFFMLWFAAKLVNSGFLKKAITKSAGGTVPKFSASMESLGAAAGGATGNSVDWGTAAFILQFVIIMIVLCASIIVAKQMSAFGAESAISGLKKAGAKLQGYAGKYTRRGAGWAAEKTLQSAEAGGKLGRAMTFLPGTSRALGRASMWREKQLKEKRGKYEKLYSNYSDAGLESLKRSPTTFGRRKEVIESILKQRANKKTKKEKAAQRKELLENGTVQEKIMAMLEEISERSEETFEEAKGAREAAAKGGGTTKPPTTKT